MRMLIPLTLVATALAFAACTRQDRADVNSDTQAAANRVGAEMKDAANSPEVEKMGAELKDAAGNVGAVLKSTAKGAAEGAREGVAKVEGDSNTEHKADKDPKH